MLGRERHAAIYVHRIPFVHGVIESARTRWPGMRNRSLAPSPFVVVFTGVRLAKPLSVYVEEGVGVGSVDMCVSGYV
jgi:hypothetical protein